MIKFLKRQYHRIEHRFGWNYGEVVTWWQEERLMVGFKCDKCGKVGGIAKVPDSITYPER